MVCVSCTCTCISYGCLCGLRSIVWNCYTARPGVQISHLVIYQHCHWSSLFVVAPSSCLHRRLWSTKGLLFLGKTIHKETCQCLRIALCQRLCTPETTPLRLSSNAIKKIQTSIKSTKYIEEVGMVGSKIHKQE